MAVGGRAAGGLGWSGHQLGGVTVGCHPEGRRQVGLGRLVDPGVVQAGRHGRKPLQQPVGEVVRHRPGHGHHRGLAGVVGELDAGLPDPLDHLGDQVGIELDGPQHRHHIVLGQTAPRLPHPDQGLELIDGQGVEAGAGTHGRRGRRTSRPRHNRHRW